MKTNAEISLYTTFSIIVTAMLSMELYCLITQPTTGLIIGSTLSLIILTYYLYQLKRHIRLSNIQQEKKEAT